MALRCVYTDLDDTLLGPDASLFRNAEGRFTLLPARALEACHRAGCEVMLMSGRRRSQVAEDARLIGHTAYAFEIGGGLVIDAEETWLCGDLGPRDGRTPWELIEASGAPELLLGAYAGNLEPHAPWHTGREISHLFRGWVDVDAAQALLEREGHAGLRLVDNGAISGGRRVYHLLPAAASKHAAVRAHMTSRGYRSEECIAVGDSREDLGMIDLVGRFFLVANAPEEDPRAERTESGYGEGFYEAVVRSLAELRSS
jgi:hydroxymethylpyrimidine pyrophosphatase-like HAD family hydrolase